MLFSCERPLTIEREAISWLIGWAIIKLIVSEKLDDHEFLSMLPWLVEVADVVPSITSIT